MIENGETLPSIAAKDRDGNETTVEQLTAGTWSVVLFYRGHW